MNAAISLDLLRNRREILRHLRNGHYERTPNGILLPRMGAHMGGHFESWINGEDHQVDANLVVLTGLDTLLATGIAAGTYYLAPYSSNVTPTNSLTAATAPGTLGEFTNYTQSARVLWNKDAAASQAISNATNKAVFTADTGGGTIWGAFMGTTNTKSATTGTLIQAAKFAASRVLLATDTLTLQYTLGLTST